MKWVLWALMFGMSSVGAAAREPLSLANELRGYVLKLNHSIDTYHYVKREVLQVNPTGNLDLQDPKILNHVRDGTNYYWDLSQTDGGGDVGGFYLATDSVVSRTFGGDHWLLYRVELKAGLTYLDVTSLYESADEIPAPILAKLKSQGCNVTEWHYLFYKSFEPGCREIALKTLKDLNVDFIAYPWQSSDYSPCTFRPLDAFILLRPERVPDAAVKIFYAESSHNGADINDVRLLESAFLRVQPNAVYKGMGGSWPQLHPNDYKLWPELDPQAVSDEEFQRYLKTRVWGCVGDR